MRVGGISFSFVTAIEPIPDAVTGSLDIFPQARYKNTRGLPINRYGHGPFCRFTIPDRSGCQRGLYLVMLNDAPVYVGQCVHFIKRWRHGYGTIHPRNCFKGGQQTNCRVNMLILSSAKNGGRLNLYFHDIPDDDLAGPEMRLIREISPDWNLSGRTASHGD